ncbi:ROK family glucokinase [Acrocarpospora macrocephala]|uniref:Glucokinase n=1 Tax=Acrocarpospora macrocephala TaxID=150177 RepID=A0A5M3X091_9ACTN|nr:glucokinase [Acrocarpospora macrocephala]
MAVDIGGTKTALAIAAPPPEANGAYLARRRFPTPATGRETLDTLLAITRELAADHAVAGIGVSFGGQVRTDRPPHLKSLVVPGWEILDLRAEFARAFGGAPTLIANDGEAAAHGEYVSMPAGARRDTLAYITVSTGVGGAFLLNGRPHRGRHGLAAEVGHIPVRPGGRCPCGGTGHLEAYASGPAIAQAAEARLTNARSSLHDVIRERGSLTAKDIDQAARHGDAFATMILGEAGTLVGRAAALIGLLLDPDAIIIGGGVAQAGDAFWHPLHTAARLDALHPTEILPARLGPDSALRGALELARMAATELPPK